ncbi:M20/M25/M40 family metallo-hydrolase [Sphingomonadaceae bacterium]|nr:M20/M25/M40 family metallo-hydrolase [Sphingomonadaceae bacterium]
MRNWVWLAVISLAAACLAIFATTPPSPLPQDAPDAAFSASRAMVDIERVASAPHPTGSEKHAEVRAYLVERMTALGMEVSTQEAPLPERSAQRLAKWHELAGSPMADDAPAPSLVNITGILRGSDPSLPAVMLMSHYDTVVGSPGAADDTAGVAVSLEVIRALKAAGPLRRDVVVLMTDAEELGLNGARYFFGEDPRRESIGTVINMEARGSGGRTGLFETSEQNGEAVRVFADSVSRPSGTSLSVIIYRLLPNNTDLTPALDGDYASYNFAFIGRPGLYHSPDATPANLDQGSIQDMGAQVLSLSAALADAETLPGRSPDLSFFDVFGLATLAFAPGLGWLFLLAGLAGYVAAIVLPGRGKPDVKALLRGAGRGGALMVLVVLATWLLKLIAGLGSGELAYYDGLAAIPRLEWVALLASAAAAAVVLRAGSGKACDWAGFALVPFAIGIGLQIGLPSAAYIVTVPLMLAGLGALVFVTGGKAGKAVAAVTAVLVLAYNIGLAHQVMQGIGADVPMAVSLPVTLAAMALLPFWPAWPARRVWQASAALLIVAAAIALWVRLDPVADTVAVYAQAEGWKDKGAEAGE